KTVLTKRIRSESSAMSTPSFNVSRMPSICCSHCALAAYTACFVLSIRPRCAAKCQWDHGRADRVERCYSFEIAFAKPVHRSRYAVRRDVWEVLLRGSAATACSRISPFDRLCGFPLRPYDRQRHRDFDGHFGEAMKGDLLRRSRPRHQQHNCQRDTAQPICINIQVHQAAKLS